MYEKYSPNETQKIEELYSTCKAMKGKERFSFDL